MLSLFAWVPSMREELVLPGVEVTSREDAVHVPAKFDTVLAPADEGRHLTGEIDYAVALCDRATVQREVRQCLRVLCTMTERPEAPIADLTPLDENEQRQLVANFSTGPASGAPAPTGLLERFAKQVRERRHQPVVVAGDTVLDYAAPDSRANRLAHALIAPRTVELAAGLLGILKAEAAYLPLDTEQPAERLAAMVSHRAPALALTDQPEPASPGRLLWENLAKVEAEDLRSRLVRTSASTRQVLQRQDVALADVLTGWDGAGEGSPFDALFVLENTGFQALRLPGCVQSPLWYAAPEAKCPLTASVWRSGDESESPLLNGVPLWVAVSRVMLLLTGTQGRDARPVRSAFRYASTPGIRSEGEYLP
ncbi:AMP-binding protein [Streptomyces olivaceoviridis]|uniref:AMP-binding protein n=1 Tax=Streptomyces olivaceoviridis TaxID=1921 RepID=UPI0036C71389